MKRIFSLISCIVIINLFFVESIAAQSDVVVNGRTFAWVNPLPKDIDLPPGVHHSTFVSPSMDLDVGYVIYLPPEYTAPQNTSRRYPVVYFLHGGRPGNESLHVRLTHFLHEAMVSGEVSPAIYVFENGGAISHYNYSELQSMGEDVFIKELIPHVDATYRTIASRRGRAIQGFSQGGRGTTRIMFKYPELFISAAPGGSGYSVEKIIFENDGVEFDTRRENPPRYEFGKGNDAFTLAQSYSDDSKPQLSIAVWVGDKGMNYDSNLDYMSYLDSLNIPYKALIVPDVAHDEVQLYERIGVDLMNFHAENFE